MGILRADRVSGLGGANAITGSVYFKGAQNLRTSNTADLRMGSSDLTVECWWYTSDLSTDVNFVSLWNSSSNKRSWGLYWDADTNTLYFNGSTDGTNSDMSQSVSWTPSANTWYHISATKIGTTIALYVDGSSLVSSAKSGTYYENTDDPIVIGGQMAGTSYDSKILRGSMSNLRIIKGEGIYTGAFTVPAQRLEKTADTVLLCCQSPGDITQEATGKDLVPYRSTVNDAWPIASHFTPDVGEDHGITFEDNTKFDTLSYMVPPGGTTAESNRGRGILFGGEATPQVNTIQYVQIQSTGNAIDFGDLTQVSSAVGAVASSTRALSAGGWVAANTNVISYVTIATSSNATDFGDLAEAKHWIQGGGSQTRGIFAGGNANSPIGHTNTVEYVTIATAGNASNFGDIARKPSTSSGSAMNSSTRAVFGGGTDPSGNALNTLEYVTIATTGDATDFGDMTDNKIRYGGCSSSTRGIIAAGGTPSVTNSITYITIATTGNTSDFGDVTTARQNVAAVTNSIRGLVVGGSTPSDVNTIDYITIASLGNASDFGDGIITGDHTSGCSDSHGGLS